jgi:hypothetical protein
MTSANEPSEANNFLAAHANRLIASLRRWTGRDLVDRGLSPVEQARRVFHASFVVLSHDPSPDPLLNYANLAGLRLFELAWEELIRLPSWQTAEPVHREERARLLETVTRQGYIDDYRGIRISRSGRRFWIERATVWNLLDENDTPCGQAATFSEWQYLD